MRLSLATLTRSLLTLLALGWSLLLTALRGPLLLRLSTLSRSLLLMLGTLSRSLLLTALSWSLLLRLGRCGCLIDSAGLLSSMLL